MSKKMYAALLPVIAVAAMAMTATAAQAAPHWYSEGTKLGENKPLEVSTFGKLTLTDSTAGLSVKCNVLDEGTITNPVEGAAGTDEITVFENHKCVATPACTSGVTITAEKLPWKTVLSEPVAGTFRDTVKGIQIKLVCTSSSISEVFTGELTPKFSTGARDSFFEFGAGSGELSSVNLGKEIGRAHV